MDSASNNLTKLHVFKRLFIDLKLLVTLRLVDI